jgi:hypothetical protein
LLDVARHDGTCCLRFNRPRRPSRNGR